MDQQRKDLVALARRGSEKSRITRRANAIVLLDRGMSCAEVATVLLIDDDTGRAWLKSDLADGLPGLRRFEAGGSACAMSDDQIAAFVAWVDTVHPASKSTAGAWIATTFGLSCSKAGLIALMNRVGLAYIKPVLVPRVIDEAAQRAFIAACETLLNRLTPPEMVMFTDAVHPAHQGKAAGCWVRRAAKDDSGAALTTGSTIAVAANSGRDRINVQGAIDLATGRTVVVEALRIDAASTIAMLERIETAFPTMTRIVVFADQAAYHRAAVVKDWLARPGRRVEMCFVPVYCPHLNPVERLWGAMHRDVTHNRSHATKRDFARAVLTFLRNTVPKHFDRFRDRITDNFRIVKKADFRILT